jgi:hypothetical protein
MSYPSTNNISTTILQYFSLLASIPHKSRKRRIDNALIANRRPFPSLDRLQNSISTRHHRSVQTHSFLALFDTYLRFTKEKYFIQLIHNMLSDSTARIIINDSMTYPFPNKKGVKQEDPISPQHHL